MEAVAAGLLAKVQRPAREQVHRASQLARARKFAQNVRMTIIRSCAEPLQGQGSQRHEQAREAGALLGGTSPRRQDHVDGQALSFSGLSLELVCKNWISSHNSYDSLIWCGLGYPQKEVKASDFLAQNESLLPDFRYAGARGDWTTDYGTTLEGCGRECEMEDRR